jgi:hypothetical protein
VKVGMASDSGLLAVADAMRLGTAPNTKPTAFDLWRMADLKAAEKNGDRRAIRIVLFRHASIHAGLLTTKRGTPYRRCSMCRQQLAGVN